MAKNKRKQRSKNNRTKPQPAKISPKKTPVQEAQELEKESQTSITSTDVIEEPIPDSATLEELQLALQMALQAKVNYEAGLTQINKEKESLEKLRVKVEKDQEQSKITRDEASKRLTEAKEIEEKNSEKCARLATMQKDIVKREENAKDGFLEENMTSLQGLQQQAEELRTTIAATNALNSQKMIDCEKECADRVAALDKREDELKAFERELKKRKRQVEWQEEDIKEIAESQCANEVEKEKLMREQVEARLDVARKEAERRDGRIRELEDVLAKIGDRSIEEVVTSNNRLSQELETALAKLKKLPAEETATYVKKLESKIEEITAANHDLQIGLAEARRKESSSIIAVTELETLRQKELSLETSCELLKNANKTLRAEYEQIIEKAGEKTPFESCFNMDVTDDLQSPPLAMRNEIDLSTLCEELQQRMAFDPDTGKTLYYSLEDVRCFVAGLCTSRLHILQGISGTGKTSLPMAFARAIGAGSGLVPVQAGWRDREDLIGHYNSFQKKYYESDFLKALYEAQCPAYSERPYIIVLDEMNLSHPEQYFADFISLIEQERNKQIVPLTTFPVANAPTLFMDNSKLPIPNNVWFIGTANHDETTMDFADKTYSRSHVMELPRHPEEFPVNKHPKHHDPIALSAIIGAGEYACSKFSVDAQNALSYFNKEFRDILGKSFNIGWSNRFEMQLKRYVPTVLACGGSLGEATDHILATKLLRKLRGRHDNTEKDIKEIKEILEGKWIENNHRAKKSLDVIDEAMRLVM